jgi:putative ABC transport system permease protein
MNGQILLVGKARYPLLSPRTFDLSQLMRVQGCQGVRAVFPVYIETLRSILQYPGAKRQYVRVVAFDPRDDVFQLPGLAKHEAALCQPDTAVVDALSKRDIYPPELQRQNEWPEIELSGRSIRIVGTFNLGTDFAINGTLITSSSNFARYYPDRAPGKNALGRVDVGVVQLDDEADAKLVQQQLRHAIPGVDVYTKSEYIDREAEFWTNSTPVGTIFGLGMALGFVVGVIICYQIIYSDIADHMPEFATLKAMGYRNRFFVAFVIEEAFYLSVLSFLPGLLISWSLYWCLARGMKLLFIMDPTRAAMVFLATLAMCLVSGTLAMRKLLKADPASLF